MNIQKYIITTLILILSTTIISCDSLRSNNEDNKNENTNAEIIEENKQLLNEITNIRNELKNLKKSIESKADTNNPNSSLPNLNVLPSIADLVELTRPGVVSIVISSTQNTFFGRQDSEGAGSGIIISEDGYILTNSHVVDLANVITVSFDDETKSEAELIGQDPLTDLAVIKVNKSGLTPLSISTDNNLRVGDWVVAIGNAIGLEGEPTVTLGIVSALERELAIDSTYLTELIQTDAVINPGNSGGPLLNLNGDVIGINTIKYVESSTDGIGFAISSETAHTIMQQLIQNGRVIWPWIGIGAQDIDLQIIEELDLNVTEGVLIRSISPNGPAEKGGLLANDIIVEIDEKPIRNVKELQTLRQTGYLSIGQEIIVTIIRDKTIQNITITLEEQPRL
ncbi:MAG: trypsin-like serine protease [SAR202 cluster bacterium]|nr:peptidase S1 [Chloroflexota bacterium]MQG50954.1 trypsin-like serine protease [SAR202 cluster bacterium]